MISNSHVGNEWYTEAQVNGKNVEEQDKIPDVAETSGTIKASSVSASDKTVKLQVTVTENRGRYSGHTAVWEFTYTIKKQK